MNKKTKNKLKEIGTSLVKGFKETKKFVGEYGPKAHEYFSKTSGSAMNAVAVHPNKDFDVGLVPRRPYVDLPLRPVKVGKKKYQGKFRRERGGNYLDFT